MSTCTVGRSSGGGSRGSGSLSGLSRCDQASSRARSGARGSGSAAVDDGRGVGRARRAGRNPGGVGKGIDRGILTGLVVGGDNAIRASVDTRAKERGEMVRTIQNNKYEMLTYGSWLSLRHVSKTPGS